MAIIFLCYACAKEDGGPTEISGIIKDGLSNRTLPLADVFLLASGKGFMTPDTQFAYCKADKRGAFSFSFNAPPGSFYTLCSTFRKLFGCRV